jgi:uncharacterized protein
MKCPACGNPLSNMIAGNVSVDACRSGCGGVWLDNFELKRIDENGAAALAHIWRDPEMHVDHNHKRFCPKCEEQPMHRRFFSRKRAVEIDECPNCAGIWLDGGEFEQIHAETHPHGQPSASLTLAISAAVSVVRIHTGR